MLPMIGKSQNTCLTAVAHTPSKDWQSFNFTPSSNVFWYKFTGDTLPIYFASTTVFDTIVPISSVTSVSLYNGTCSQLNLLVQDSTSVHYNQIANGVQYYVKIEFTSQPQSFSLLSVFRNLKSAGDLCDPTSCDPIPLNGNFITMDPLVNGAVYPFVEEGWICAWDKYNISPQATTEFGYLDEGYARMWGMREYNEQAEGIFQNILIPEGEYDVAMAYRLDAVTQNNCDKAILNIADPSYNYINDNLLDPSINIITVNNISSLSWNMAYASYTSTQNQIKKIIVMPYQLSSSVCWINFDNIHLTPKPTLSVTQNLCKPSTIIFTLAAELCHQTTQSITWDFGDGNIVNSLPNETTISHTYAQVGSYNLTVTVSYQYFSESTNRQVALTVPVDFNSNTLFISGNKSTCDDITSYTLESAPSGQNYQWTILPSNAGTIVSGNGTSTVSIDWNSQNMNWTSSAFIEVYNPLCDETVQYRVWKCCYKPDGNEIVYGDESLTSNLSGVGYFFNGEMLIESNVTISNTCINMGPEAKILVKPPYSLTLNNTIVREGCNYMWDGIYAEQPTNTIITQNNTIIMDAYNAIVSERGAVINATNTLFNLNLDGIIVKNYSGTNPLTVRNCKFYSTTDATGTVPYVLRAPHDYRRGRTGIVIEDMASVTVGNPVTTDNNKFSYIELGIDVLRSNVNIYNNTFLNLPQVNGNGGIGVKFMGDATNNILNFGSTTSLYTNTLTNCKVGMQLINSKHSVLLNNFTSCEFAINSIDPVSQSVINNNTATTCTNGFDLSDVMPITNKRIDVINNTFTAPVNYAIKIQNINSSSFTSDRVSISSNNVNYTSFNLLVYRRSIWVNATPNIIITCNKVNNTTADLANAIQNSQRRHDDRMKTIGIGIYNTANATVRQNTLTKMGTGIWGEGNLGNTQFSYNSNVRSYWGFYFNPNTTNTIVDQGSASWGNSNTWTDFTNSITFPYNERNWRISGTVQWVSPNKKKWYYWNIANQTPDLVQGNGNIASDCMIRVIVPGSAISIPPCPTFGGGGGGTNSITENSMEFDETNEQQNQLDVQFINQLAEENIYSQTLSDEEISYTQIAAYKIISEQANLINQLETNNIGEFASQLISSNVPQFVQIGFAYQNGNISDAIAQNNTVVAINTIEKNSRFVNHVVLLMYSNAYQMDEDLMDELRKIALQEPYYGGEAVYRARTLLKLSNESISTMSHNTIPIINKSSESISIFIYPNPVNEKLHVKISNQDDNANMEVQICNIYGQPLIQVSNLNSDINMIDVSALKKGLYFTSIYIDGKLTKTQKFVKE